MGANIPYPEEAIKQQDWKAIDTFFNENKKNKKIIQKYMNILKLIT